MGNNNLPDGFDDHTARFFMAFYEKTAGDLSAQASMYEIGEQIGLDRTESSRAAETLMAEGWVEIRTLAGGIGITRKAIDALSAADKSDGHAQNASCGLGPGALLEEASRRNVEAVVAALKRQVEAGGLGFADLAELVADIETIDAQLASPRPKTAILRACFESILGIPASADFTKKTNQIKQLLA